MELRYKQVSDLPGLAWCLRVHNNIAEVLHGPLVETQDSFFTDGVWAGDFDETNLDQHFLCGTGAVLREDTLHVASASSPMDRVFTTRISGELFASNSLPFFLAMTDDTLDDTRMSYRSLFVGTTVGLRIAPRTFTTSKGRTVRVLLDEVASINGRGEVRIELRPLERDFSGFADYRSHLAASVKDLVENGSDPDRKTRYQPLLALSTGYDSIAVGVLLREAGGQESVTMMRYASDTGEPEDYPGTIADRLGFRLHGLERDTWRERTDLPDAEVAAAAAHFIDIPTLALEDHLPGKMLFVGHSGDNVWTRDNFRHYRDVVRGDTSGQGLAEYRLRVGFVVCPVPYIGHTAHPSLYRLANSPEMAPWSVGGHYDRPIPRRIIEEAGIERGTFATRKFGGAALVGSGKEKPKLDDRPSLQTYVSEFMTVAGTESFLGYWEQAHASKSLGKMKLGLAAHWFYKKLDALNYRVGRRLHRFGVKGAVPRRVMALLASRLAQRTDDTYLLPHWGAKVMKEKYVEALANK